MPNGKVRISPESIRILQDLFAKGRAFPTLEQEMSAEAALRSVGATVPLWQRGGQPAPPVSTRLATPTPFGPAPQGGFREESFRFPGMDIPMRTETPPSPAGLPTGGISDIISAAPTGEKGFDIIGRITQLMTALPKEFQTPELISMILSLEMGQTQLKRQAGALTGLLGLTEEQIGALPEESIQALLQEQMGKRRRREQSQALAQLLRSMGIPVDLSALEEIPVEVALELLQMKQQQAAPLRPAPAGLMRPIRARVD